MRIAGSWVVVVHSAPSSLTCMCVDLCICVRVCGCVRVCLCRCVRMRVTIRTCGCTTRWTSPP